jgi:cytidylate kinase
VRRAGLVVAIDGPSGAGKSTAGRALAARLGYTYVDTGAMYRALAVKALRAGLDLEDGAGLATLLASTRIELLDSGRRVLLDGEDVTAAIRAREVSGASSRVSVHSAVRAQMRDRQREMGRDGGVVLDGRDVGTAIFPDAEVKFYLDAEPHQRALRRHDELQRGGVQASLEAVEREVSERDFADTHRADSPLVRAAEAVALDTTGLGPAEVLDRMAAVVEARLAAAR